MSAFKPVTRNVNPTYQPPKETSHDKFKIDIRKVQDVVTSRLSPDGTKSPTTRCRTSPGGIGDPGTYGWG